VLEVQLMPALSQMVLEAAGMAQEQGLAVDADGGFLSVFRLNYYFG
jgi:predicted amino acid dehydrogenase